MLYKYKEMNVMVMEDINYINFTAERRQQYPVLIEEALLDSDRMGRVMQTYPEYFQRSETHICFNYDWFYKELGEIDKMKVFNKIMVVAYSDQIKYIVSHGKKKDTNYIDTYI